MSKTSIYDKDDYYDKDGVATRLSKLLNPLLHLLDWTKATLFYKKSALGCGNILDVGAGDGKFLFFMKKLGFNTFGTTASKTSKKAAFSLFKIELEYTTSLSDSICSRRYKGITYWHVFEHLENPKEHVEKWPYLLSEGGTILIEVPNIESIGARLNFDSWLGADVKHHINHMTKKEISALLCKNNLVIQRDEGFSLKFSYVFLWSSLLGLIFGKSYQFDFVFDILKNPFDNLKKCPILTLNGIMSVFYLFPIILPLLVLGIITGKGEVLRLYIKRRSQTKNE